MAKKKKKKKESWKQYADAETLRRWKQHELKVRQEQEIWEMGQSFLQDRDEIESGFLRATAGE